MSRRLCIRALRLAAVAVLALAASVPTFVRAAPAGAAEKVVTTAPVKIRIWTEKGHREVTVIGRTADALQLAPDAGGGSTRFEIATIKSCEFVVDYDRFAVTKAVYRSDWSEAVRLLNKPFEPTFPYLDLPDNAAAETVLDLATYMMHIAERTGREATNETQLALSRRQYEAAHGIFAQCAKVGWSTVGQLGILKGCRCLIAMNKPKTAGFHIEQMAAPEPGDAAYGHYWLVKAELAALAKDYRAAMDAAVKSLCFENKDVETYPDALLLSARCYLELLEPHRARDVYYEVAKLFPRTDWAAVAIKQLRAIMAQKLTADDETAPLESVFFGLKEDMNALVEQLFKDIEQARPEEDGEVEAQAAAKPTAPTE